MDFAQSSYIERLTPYLKALKSARQTLSALPPDKWDRVLKDMLSIARSLKGSGANYGFPRISHAADGFIKARQENTPSRLDELIETIEALATEKSPAQMTILLICSDRDLSGMVKSGLTNPFRKVHVAESGLMVLDMLTEMEVALILLDDKLIDQGGRSMMVSLFKRTAASEIPIIVLLSEGSAITRTECFALGAVDYLEKPVDLDILSATVSAGLFLKSGSPGLLQKKMPISIALVEIDALAEIDRQRGEDMGGEVIRHLLAQMERSFRKSDYFEPYRRGGIVTVFPETHPEGTERALHKLLTNFKEAILKTGEKSIMVNFSAGVAELRTESTIKETVVRAKQLLNHSREIGHTGFIAVRGASATVKGKIIIAEDDVLIASVVKHRLELNGFEVEHLNDSEAVLKLLNDKAISLFIIDARMPIMDGFELVEQIRRKPELDNVPIVMLSPPGRERDIVRAFELGANDYVTKPFSPVELKARIDRLLQSK